MAGCELELTVVDGAPEEVVLDVAEVHLEVVVGAAIAEGIVALPIEHHADLATIEKTLQRETKLAKSGAKEAIKFVGLLEKARAHLDRGKPVRNLQLEAEQQSMLKPLCLLTSKPSIYVANVDEKGFTHNRLLDRVQEYAESEGAPVVAICAVTASLRTAALVSSTQRLPKVTDRYQKAMITPFIAPVAWL